jgi:predicted nucleic acid-binding protein
MIFDDIPAGEAVFVDANSLVYHFSVHPVYGSACKALIERIELKLLQGYTSSHVLGEMAHRLMTIEACTLLGRHAQGIAPWLKRHPAEVQQLTRYRQAIDELSLFGIQVLPIDARLISLAADVSRQTGLLCNDALIVAVMRNQGLTHLASNDADFDRVPGITRYAPV